LTKVAASKTRQKKCLAYFQDSKSRDTKCKEIALRTGLYVA